MRAFQRLLLTALLLVIALYAPGSAGSDPSGSEEIIIVGTAQDPTSLDPTDHRSREAETVIRNMFDGLVTRDTRSGVHLELAESLEWLDDTTLEVKLRKGVRFHDGEGMSADDVVFTFERVKREEQIEYPKPHTSPRQGLIAPLESVEAKDDYTVVMNFSAPWPAAMQMLVHQQIVPKHYLQEVGTEGFVSHPIGTGPFKFVSAVAGQVVMERFDDYYGGAPDLEPVGPACAKEAVFRVIPDGFTRALALLAGEVDIIQGLPAELLETVKANPNLQVKTAPGTQPKWMDMNVNLPPFDDVRVRQALNYAVDKQLIIEAVYGGRAEALPGPLSPHNHFVNKELEPYPYYPAKALRLLREAGWSDSDQDGVLERDGEPFSFTMDTLAQWRPLAEAVVSQFRKLGVDADVRLWEYPAIMPLLQEGERQAYLDDWGDSAFDPVGHFDAKWHGPVPGQPYGQANWSGYNNARVNELIKLGEITADPVERQKIYDEAQDIVYHDAPAVFLVLPEELEAASIAIKNWEPASDSRVNLHDVCRQP